MGRGSDRVGPRDQQSPVVSCVSCGDVMAYLLHTDGGVGNSFAILKVRDCAFNSSVNLKKQKPPHAHK